MGRCVETGSAIAVSTIYYAGDSTVQFNCFDSYPQTGLGQVLPRFLKDEYPVKNHGKNGRSTKSFIDEGRLDVIANSIKEGDFLFIQFGHNDEKKVDASRYTEPFGSYKTNLVRFINTARKNKAYPVLITPVERCHFENGRLYDGEHGDYVKAMKEVAKEENVPCVDLYSATRQIMDEAGEEKALTYYVQDGTHMTMDGAIRYGLVIAKELKKLGAPYADMLIDEI